MRILKNLHLVDYDSKTQDKELVCMVMLWSLHVDFDAFCSSLNLIDNLTRSKLEDTFKNEDIIRTHRLDALPPLDSLRPLWHHLFKSDFRGLNGHTEDRCFKRINQQLQGKLSQANAVQEVPQLDSGIVQFTGSASVHSLHPSDPLSPLQLDADDDWNT
ncbi:hypothetical protein EW146_g10477 [Bondarzewia mesenterica]|uniref:Uncharacterized protein n=1 Tax=Bondarzewia mesenterica TaxID=1095465 RepID=A0A4S4KYJ7_9AGAM|nr:hypothetical protein EW146_g10477 [Bondarzewia mesenterica]